MYHVFHWFIKIKKNYQKINKTCHRLKLTYDLFWDRKE